MPYVYAREIHNNSDKRRAATRAQRRTPLHSRFGGLALYE